MLLAELRPDGSAHLFDGSAAISSPGVPRGAWNGLPPAEGERVAHWLHRPEGGAEVWMWEGGGWWRVGLAERVIPEDLGALGYRYARPFAYGPEGDQR